VCKHRAQADLGSADQEKDIEAAATEATSYHEKAAAPIMECYRACVSDSKADVEHTRRLAILNLTNHLFRIYFSVCTFFMLVCFMQNVCPDQQIKSTQASHSTNRREQWQHLAVF
jgi:hypothetical protein